MAETASQTNQSGTGKTVLVIDDDYAILEITKEVLTQHGYSVDFAEDGETGLEKLTHNYFDLTLLGLMIPKYLGIDVLRRVQATGIKHGKIVMYTNLSTKLSIDEAFALGADGYELMVVIIPNMLADRVDEYISGVLTKEAAHKRALEELEQSFDRHRV